MPTPWSFDLVHKFSKMTNALAMTLSATYRKTYIQNMYNISYFVYTITKIISWHTLYNICTLFICIIQVKSVSATKLFTCIYEINLNIFCLYVFLKVADSAFGHRTSSVETSRKYFYTFFVFSVIINNFVVKWKHYKQVRCYVYFTRTIRTLLDQRDHQSSNQTIYVFRHEMYGLCSL